MKPDTENFFAVEIKREIAERYFGFRKMIEEDTQALQEKINNLVILLEKNISYELIRIYILLKDEALIQQFMELSGWHQRLFYEPYITGSPTIRKKVLADIRLPGLTRAARFKNLVFDTYGRLATNVEQYRQNLEEVKMDRETINAEIELFYKKNDIGNIMGFLRAMEGEGGEPSMGVTPAADAAETLEQKMRIAKPLPIPPELIALPPLMPLPNIRKEFKKIIEKAYKGHGKKILAELAQ